MFVMSVKNRSGDSGKIINLDYETIIQASTCIDNNIFVIYNRKYWSPLFV